MKSIDEIRSHYVKKLQIWQVIESLLAFLNLGFYLWFDRDKALAVTTMLLVMMVLGEEIVKDAIKTMPAHTLRDLYNKNNKDQ